MFLRPVEDWGGMVGGDLLHICPIALAVERTLFWRAVLRNGELWRVGVVMGGPRKVRARRLLSMLMVTHVACHLRRQSTWPSRRRLPASVWRRVE